MPDTPGLRRRLELGDLPEWMRVAAARRAEEPDRPQQPPWWHDQVPDRTPKPTPTPTPAPEPAREPDDDTEPARPLPIPHPRREHVPPPPLPRRSDRPRRPASHRKPRRYRRIGHLLTGYALAALAGAAVQPLITFLS